MKKTSKTGVLTTDDLDKIAGLLDKQFEMRLEPLATTQFVNDKVDSLETSLKTYMDGGVEMIMAGMDSLEERVTEKDKVNRLAEWAKRASTKIGIEINI